MKTRLLALLLPLSMAFPVPIFSQAYGSRPLEDGEDVMTASLMDWNIGVEFENAWNVGSAKRLRGKTYVLELWLTEVGTQWDWDEMVLVQGKINEALGWLTDLAAYYGVEATFEKGSYYGSGAGVTLEELPSTLEECTSSPILTPQALSKIGYNGGVMQCYDQLMGFDGVDNVLVLAIMNKVGWNSSFQFSIKHILSGMEDYFLESAYIFKEQEWGPVTPQSIAHEILHLYGAWDLYGGQVSEEADSFAKENYPYEIMLQVSDPLKDLDISPLTAWLIGLSSEVKDWFWLFKRLPQQFVGNENVAAPPSFGPKPSLPSPRN